MQLDTLKGLPHGGVATETHSLYHWGIDRYLESRPCHHLLGEENWTIDKLN